MSTYKELHSMYVDRYTNLNSLTAYHADSNTIYKMNLIINILRNMSGDCRITIILFYFIFKFIYINNIITELDNYFSYLIRDRLE